MIVAFENFSIAVVFDISDETTVRGLRRAQYIASGAFWRR